MHVKKDIGVADECGSTLYFGRSDEVPGKEVFLDLNQTLERN